MRFGIFGETTLGASQMDWYDADGSSMSVYDWNSPENRTLQYLAASTPEHEAFNRILLVIHGIEAPVTVTLPVHHGVVSYTELWNSGEDAPHPEEGPTYPPGTALEMAPSSLRLFRAN